MLARHSLRWSQLRQEGIGALGMPSELSIRFHTRAFGTVDHHAHFLDLPCEASHFGSRRNAGLVGRR